MKLLLAFSLTIFTAFFASADPSAESQRILSNPIVAGFISAQSADKQCHLVQFDNAGDVVKKGDPIAWQCRGLVMPEMEEAFNKINSTKLKNTGICGFAVIFDCGKTTVTLGGNIEVMQVFGANNKSYGTPYETISFDINTSKK